MRQARWTPLKEAANKLQTNEQSKMKKDLHNDHKTDQWFKTTWERNVREEKSEPPS